MRSFLDNLWRWKCGLPDLTPAPPVTPDELRASEWSPEFERLMRNRLMMGALRYGRLGAEGKPQYDRIASAVKRLQQYDRTGNQELLVDAANLCLVEFVEGRHPTRHFHAVDDGEHVEVKCK